MARLFIEPLYKNVILPEKATTHAAAYDVHAYLLNRPVVVYDKLNNCSQYYCDNKILIKSGERVMIPTGMKMCCDPGWKIEIAPRSGNSIKKGLMLSNSIGIIDADFRHEAMILLTNISNVPVLVKHGSRIAQISLEQVFHVDMVIGQLPEIESNRNGGFGHSGGAVDE